MDAMPSRPVLPPLFGADLCAIPVAPSRRKLGGAAMLSAALHGGLLAMALLLIGGAGGQPGLAGENGVTLVTLASASELPGPPSSASQAAPTPADAADSAPDPLQSAAPQPAEASPPPLQQADLALPPKAEPVKTEPAKVELAKIEAPKPAPAKPASKQIVKPARPAAKPTATPTAQIATSQSTASSADATTAAPGQASAGTAASGAGSNSAGGVQVASLPPGPLGAFDGQALAARFRSQPAPPVYPKRALSQNQQGVATVRALIDERGHAQDIRLYASSGYPMLDRAALEAVSRWDFLPATRDGHPVSAWVEVPVRFHID